MRERERTYGGLKAAPTLGTGNGGNYDNRRLVFDLHTRSKREDGTRRTRRRRRVETTMLTTTMSIVRSFFIRLCSYNKYMSESERKKRERLMQKNHLQATQAKAAVIARAVNDFI